MDSEAAVIRAEMSQTRAELDRKIARLEERARQLSLRQYVARHKPDYLADRLIGAALTLAGLTMVWRELRRRQDRRNRLRAILAMYGGW